MSFETLLRIPFLVIKKSRTKQCVWYFGPTLELVVTFPTVSERKRKQPAKATCQTQRKRGIISEMPFVW